MSTTELQHPGCCLPNRGARGTSKAKRSPTTAPLRGSGTVPRCSRWAPLPEPLCFRKCFRCFRKSIFKIREHGKLATLAGISRGIKGSSDQNPLGSSANKSLCTLHLTALQFFSLQQKIPGLIKKTDITGNNVFTTFADFCH